MENIKTLVFDMDGTLIDSSGKIQPKTKEALIELQDKGIHLILASGRPIKSMLKFAEELKLHEHKGIIISNNGSIGFDTKNMKIIYDTPIEKSLAQEILNSFEGREIWPMVESSDYFLVEDVYEGNVTLNGTKLNITEKEARAGDYLLKEVDHIADHIDDHVNKILTIVEPDIIEGIVKEYKEKFGDKIHVVQTSPFYMEFVRPESNKAYGLAKLGIDPETMMSFGDSMNDMEMLQYSKYPISMGNGRQEVKDAAVYVTDDLDNEGIYKALQHFNLI